MSLGRSLGIWVKRGLCRSRNEEAVRWGFTGTQDVLSFVSGPSQLLLPYWKTTIGISGCRLQAFRAWTPSLIWITHGRGRRTLSYVDDDSLLQLQVLCAYLAHTHA